MCTRKEGGGASTAGGQLLLHGSLTGHAGKKGKLCSKCPLEGVGAKSCPWSAPRRPESWSSAASGSLGVLSQGGDPPSLKSLRGLCHQVTCSPPPIATYTHRHTRTATCAQHGLHKAPPACWGGDGEAAQAAGPQQDPKQRRWIGGGRWQREEWGRAARPGRDVAPSLTGHQQPRHLLFLTSKGNRFVSD